MKVDPISWLDCYYIKKKFKIQLIMQVHNYIIVIEDITLDFLINFFWNQKHANLFVIMKSNLHVKLV